MSAEVVVARREVLFGGREIHWFQWGALEVPSVMEGTCSPCEIFFWVKHKLMGVEQIKYVEPNRRD